MSNILVIPREYLTQLELPEKGVRRMAIGRLHSLIIDHGMFIDRDQAERDTKYKQLVPYITIRKPSFVPPLEGQQGPEVLCYTRTKLSGEQRLVGNHSIGFGGHIEERDGKSPLLCLATGMAREIEEEVYFPTTVGHEFPAFAALINDDTNDVGQVHLGMSYLVDIEEREKEARHNITSPDDNITGLRWAKPKTINPDKFETWSQIVLEHIFEG